MYQEMSYCEAPSWGGLEHILARDSNRGLGDIWSKTKPTGWSHMGLKSDPSTHWTFDNYGGLAHQTNQITGARTYPEPVWF